MGGPKQGSKQGDLHVKEETQRRAQRDRKMEFPKFRLRKSLYLIGQNMGGHDLASLKFLSSCYGVPKGQLERIETAFELFCALEERGRIGYGNDAILRELLEARHREHLLVKYPLDEKEILETDAGGKSYNEGEKADLQKFLLGISDSLSKRDFKDLAYFLFDTDVNGTYSLQDIEKMNSGIDLFEKLLAAKLIGPKNLTALYQVLEVIGRNDLCIKIAEYLPESGAAERRRQKLESKLHVCTGILLIFARLYVKTLSHSFLSLFPYRFTIIC